MKTALAVFVVMVIPLIPLCSVGQTTGNATSTGTCNVANTGHSNNVVFQCGIGKEQGQKIVSILNKILSNQLDTDKVMAKLDELIAAQSRQGATNYSQTCNGSACAQGPNSQATFNQLGPPAPHVTWTVEEVEPVSNPKLYRVFVSVDSPPSIPAFVAECDLPCKSAGGTLGGSIVYSDESRDFATDNPNIVAILFTPHSPISVSKPLIWIISSQSDKPLRILSVKLLPDEKARTLPPQPPSK
jgi:hypothetical protein